MNIIENIEDQGQSIMAAVCESAQLYGAARSISCWRRRWTG